MLIVPDPVIGEPVIVNAVPVSVNATDVTVPPPPLLPFEAVVIRPVASTVIVAFV